MEIKTNDFQRWCVNCGGNYSRHWTMGFDLGMESTVALPRDLFSYVYPHSAIHVSFPFTSHLIT
jgi:hypothetical protein